MNRAFLRELGLAALSGVLIAVSPFTPDDLLPSVAAGIVTGVAVFAWRLRHGALAAAPPPADAPPRAPARLPWSLLLVAGLWIALFLPTFRWLYGQWTSSIWINNHGLFVPFLVGYLTYTTLRRDPAEGGEQASAWGFPLVLAGVALVLLDTGLRLTYPTLFGMLLTLPGLALLVLGAARTRALMVPLLLTLLMIPIPNSVGTHLYLRRITAAAVEPILHALGFTALRDGTTILMAQNTFVVSDACSGFATLYAAVAVSVGLACYTASRVRRILLLLAGVPLALLANIVRVLALILITDFFGVWVLDTPIHEASGVATFCVILFGLFALADQGHLKGESS